MRAVSSARSIYRASQNSESAIRESIKSDLFLEDPCILAASPLRRIHHHRTLSQRYPRQPARNHRYALAVEQAIGTQIHMAAGKSFLLGVVGGNPRQPHQRLRNVVPGVGLDLLPELL